MSHTEAAALSALLDAAERMGLIEAGDDWETVEAKLDAVKEEEAS